MNKMPLPVHLLASIPGYSMLGRTSFGGYTRIIFAWWLNDCPDVLIEGAEFRSLAGMRKTEWDLYKGKLVPVLLKSIEILNQYRKERQGKREHRLINLRKAHAASRTKLLEKKKVDKSKGNMVDKVTPVNISPVIPSPTAFHEGWNLHKPNAPQIKKQSPTTPMLCDK